MKFIACRLYATPLSPLYTDVYDQYTTIGAYSTFLQQSFPYKEINLTGVNGKSFKQVNLDAYLTIKVPFLQTSDYTDFSHYNYVEMIYNKFDGEVTTMSAKYYFILGIDELYNDTQNYTYKYTLREDVFPPVYANYNLINKGNFVSYIERKTMTNKIALNAATAPFYSLMKNFPIVNQDTILTIERLFSPQICFICIRVSSEEPLYIKSGDSYVEANESYKIGTVPSQYPAAVYYIPAFTSIDVTQTFTCESVPFTVNGFTYYVAPKYLNLFPNIIDAWYTWYGPTVSNTVISGNVLYLKNNNNYFPIISGLFTDLKTLSINLYENLPQTANNNLSGYDNCIIYDDYTKSYPFIAYSIMIGGEEIPLVAEPDNYSLYIELDKINKSTNNVKITVSGNSYKKQSFQQHLPLLKSIDSLQQYLLDNGNQIKTARANAITSGVMQTTLGAGMLLTGNPAGFMPLISGTVSPQLELLSIDSKIEDAKNKVDSFSGTSMIGTDDPWLDGIYLIKKAVSSDNIKYRWYNDMHYYGNYYNAYGNPFLRERQSFDYVRTVNTRFPFIENPLYREQFERIFENGVTMWHINANNQNSDILETLNKDCLNQSYTFRVIDTQKG